MAEAALAAAAAVATVTMLGRHTAVEVGGRPDDADAAEVTVRSRGLQKLRPGSSETARENAGGGDELAECGRDCDSTGHDVADISIGDRESDG